MFAGGEGGTQCVKGMRELQFQCDNTMRAHPQRDLCVSVVIREIKEISLLRKHFRSTYFQFAAAGNVPIRFTDFPEDFIISI